MMELAILAIVIVMRERPNLAPVLLAISFAFMLIGATNFISTGLTVSFQWLVPLLLFVVGYLIYRLYDHWEL